MHVAELGTRDDVLMHADRPFEFTPATKQTAECEMCFQGLIIDFDHAHEDFQRLIRLLVEQEVQAFDVVSIQLISAAGLLFFFITKAGKKNLSFHPYIGMEHNFFSVKEDGNVDYNAYNWDKVSRVICRQLGLPR